MSNTVGSIYVVGAGRVGSVLAMLFKQAGLDLCGIWSRTEEGARLATERTGLHCDNGALTGALAEALTNANTVVLAVRDDAVAQVAKELCESGKLGMGKVVLHCGGALPARKAMPDLVDSATVGTFHPLVAVADVEAAQQMLPSAFFALEGDEKAVQVGRALATAIGARSFVLDAEQMGLYHVAAAMASNHAVALWDVAQGLLEKVGLEKDRAREALLPLLQSTLENVQRVGLPEALTGPVRRGDTKTIQKHLEILSQHAPQYLGFYRAATAVAAEVARTCKDPPPEAKLQAIAALLNDES
ncbi:MAG: DUF2520 domain-containing protein [Pseudomonadota bacterium]